MKPLLDQIVDIAIENLKPEQEINTLDLDLLINADERVSNTTYVSILTALCHEWAHRVLAIEDQLELEEPQLVLVSKLFTRPSVEPTNLEKEDDSDVNTLPELCKLLNLILVKHCTTV